MTKPINGRICFCLSAAAIALFFAGSLTAPLRAENIPTEPGAAEFAGKVNLREVARQEALKPPALTKTVQPKGRAPQSVYKPVYKPLPAAIDKSKLRLRKMTRPVQPTQSKLLSTAPRSTSEMLPTASAATIQPAALGTSLLPTDSPPLTAAFPGVLDNGARYAPNAQGAVGSNFLMVATEDQIRYQNRAGGEVGSVSLDGFWSRIGVSNVFTPRLLYDPYKDRWIMAARAFPTTNTSKILVGVSQTADPTGNWYLYSSNFVAPLFPDTVNLGFNKNWVVVQSDIAYNDGINGYLTNSSLFIFNKTNIYAGGTNRISRYIRLTFDTEVNGQVPAITYDETEPTLDLMAVWTNDDGEDFGWLRIYQIWGPVGSETLYKAPFPDGYAWGYAWADAPDNWDDFLPQAGVTNKLYAGDSRLMNLIYRNGTLWTTHTVFQPTNSPTRSAVQWWEVAVGGYVWQNGLVEDVNDIHFYAYPSITVNRKNEVLLAYTHCAAAEFPSAHYSYHSEMDEFSSLRDDTLLKAGLAPYVKTNSSGQNMWGAYSAAVIDPLNDTDMWTLQPYASTNVGGQGRWGTWWARVTPPVDLAVSITGPGTILAGSSMTNFISVTNNRPASVDEVMLTNTLSPGATFVSATLSQGAYVFTNGQLICSLGSLNDYTGATVRVVSAPFGVGQSTNTAAVSCRGPELTPTNNLDTAVTTVLPTADLLVTAWAAPGVVNVGNSLTNFVQVTNKGPYTATGVVVTNTFPTSLTFVSASATMGTVTQSAGRVIWNVNNNFSIGANPTLTFLLTPTAPGLLTNRAVVSGTSIDLQPANNATNVVARANALPTLQILASRSINEDASTGPLSFTVGDLETPAASLQVFAISSNESLVPNNPSNLSLGGSGSNRTITVTPLPTLSGTTTVTRFVVDDDGATNTSAFVLSVAPVNDPPTLNDLSNMTLDEDASAQTVLLSGISGGPPNEPQAVSLSATSSAPSIVSGVTVSYAGGATGSLSFTPVANAFGTATVTVTVNDGGASNNLASKSFVVTINPINDLPTLNPLSEVNLNEDAGWQTNTLSGISGGPANEPQALTITASNSNPALLANFAVNYSSGSAGTLTYTTVSNAFGSAVVTVTVDDRAGSNSIVSRSFNVTVNLVNDFPALDPISDLILLEDAGPQNLPLTGITSGAANETQVLSVTVSNSGSGLLTNLSLSYTSPSPTGTLSFSLLPHVFGTNLLTLRVQDDGASNNVVSRNFKVIVVPVNDAPTLDTLPALALSEDFVSHSVILNGITAGPANEPSANLAVTAISDNLSVIAAPVVNYTPPASTGSLQLNSVPDGYGTANITVTVNDGGSSNNTVTRTFQVTVSPVNDFPTINPVANQTIPEDAGLQTVNVGGISSGAGNESQPLSVTSSNGNPALLQDVQVSYTSPASTATLTFGTVSNASGSGIITVFVNDAGASNNVVSQSFTVFVNPVNDAPTLDTPAPLTLDEDFGSFTLTLTSISAGPPNEPQMSLTLAATSSVPSVVPNPVVNYLPGSSTATLQFNSVTNLSGTTTISVRLDDGGASNSITTRAFTLTVRPVNDLPVISDIPNQVMDENTSLTVPITVWDLETSANNLLLSALSFNEEVITASGVSFSGAGTNRTMTLRPLTNQYGSATLAIMAQDTDGGSTFSTFDLTVNFVNNPPVIAPIPNQTMNQGGSLTVPLLVSDVETLPSNIVVTASASNPTLVPPSGLVVTRALTNFVLSITPAANQYGNADITITADDGYSTNNIARRTFTLHVNALPTLSTIPDQSTDEDTPLIISFRVGDFESPATNLVVTANATNPALLSSNSLVLGGTGTNRTLTVRPLTNQFGNATLTLTVRDPENALASATFNLTVIPVNDLPTLSAIPPQSTLANTPALVSFTIADAENAPSDLLLAGSSSNPGLIPSSSIVFGGSGSNRTVTLTPLLNQTGASTISLTVVDTNGGFTVASFVLTVTPVTNAPTISPLPNLTINEDTIAGPLSFTIADLDTPLASLSLSARSSNTALVPAGNIVFAGSGPDRTVTITPLTNQTGSATITLTVSDGVLSNSTSFVLTVSAVNYPPTLNALTNLTINENSGLQTVTLTGITPGPANESGQIVTIAALSSNPGLIPNPTVSYTSPATTGTLTFTPASNSNGTAVITVTLDDHQTQNNLTRRTFTVTVNPVNQAPTISSITARTTNEDCLVTIPFTVGDVETPAAMLTITASSTNAALLPLTNIVFAGTDSNRTVSLLPLTNLFGTTLITLTVSDGAATASTSFLLTIAPVNDPPTLDPLLPLFLKYNPGNITVNLGGITSGASNESQTLSLALTNSNPVYYSTAPKVQSYTSPNTNGSITFKPAGNTGGVGSNLITVTVTDNGASNNAFNRSFWVFTRPNNSLTPPYASGISNQTTPEDTPTSPLAFTVRSSFSPANLIGVFASSSNPQLLPLTNIVFGGSGSNRTVTLFPALHQSGWALVTISVIDTNFGGTNISFYYTVPAANDLPVISSFSPLTIDEDSVAGPIPFTVSDVETPAGNLTVTASSSNPTLVPGPNIIIGGSGTNRALLITPASNQTGTATITVSVNDGSASRSNSFVLTVNGLNDPPTISSLADQVSNENAPLTVNSTVGDIETAAASLTLASASSNPALVPTNNIAFGGSGSNRTATLTPLSDQFGTATISFTVSDGQGGTASQSFLLTVRPVNQPPSLDALSNVTISRAPGSNSIVVALSGIGSGSANETQTLNVTASSSNPALVPNPLLNYTSPNSTGSLTLTALGISNGTALITVTVNDGQAPSNITIRTFTVTVNGLPSISNIPVQVTAEGTPTASIPFVIGDAETPAANLTVTPFSRNSALAPNTNIQLGGTGSNRTVTVTPAARQFGSAWIDLAVTDALGAVLSNSFLLEVLWVNDPPSFDPVPNQLLAEDFGQKDILLTGISSGATNELQTLTFTVTSTNPAVIPTPVLLYTNGSSTALLRFTSITNVFGTSLITLTLRENVETNSFFSQSFLVTVNPVNDPPTLNPIAGLTIGEDSGLQIVPLSGISAGPANETQVLQVTASTTNSVLITNLQVTYTSPASTGSLRFGTVSNAFGTAFINVTVNDQGASNNLFTRAFSVTINPSNDWPLISDIPDASTAEDVPVTIPFTVWDPETPPGNLTYTAVSFNQEVIADSGISFGGTGTNRTVTIRPLPNQYGAAAIMVTVQDPAGATASSGAFEVTVAPVNDPPLISPIAPQAVNEDSSITVPFTLSDQETLEQNLAVTATSHNLILLPNSGLALSRTTTNRLLTITPATNQFGVVDITLTVNDGGASNNLATRTFLLTVVPSSESLQLHIRKANNLPVLAWSTNYGVCQLQARTDCSPTNTWTTWSVTPAITNGEYQVIVNPAAPSKIYRLLR